MIAEQKSGLTVWFTGLSGAGKSTISREVLRQLQLVGVSAQLLDADQVRQHLCRGLGFSREDREENVRRIGYVASLLTSNGVLTLVAAMSPYRSTREEVRGLIGSFLEVFVDAPIGVCEERDPIGLYRRFRAGEVQHLSGLDDPYEAPESPDIHCRTEHETVEQSAAKVVQAILARC